VGVASAVLLIAGLASLADPQPARAEVPVIGPVVKTIGGVGHTLLHPAAAAVEALVKVLQAIFGGVEAQLITGVINGLLTVPNFDTGNVAALERTTVAIAAGMLGAVLTLSIVRYYLVGLTGSGSGGFEALQGVVRVVGAVGFIILWPGIFSEVVQIPKMFNEALLGSGAVQHNVALLFDAALVVGGSVFALDGGLGLIFVVLIGFIAAIVFIALLWMKVLLSVMMMFLYVSMPLCAVLWPVPELSWLATSAMKAMFVGLLVPCVWAILFALSSAVNADILTWAPSPSIIDTVIIRPLAGITLMLLCITLPRFLMRTALIGPHGQAGGGGKVWRTVTFGMFAMRGAAGVGRTVASAAAGGNPGAARMIDALPSPISPPKGPGKGSLAGHVVFGRSGFAKDDNEKGSGHGKPPGASAQDWGAGEPAADTSGQAAPARVSGQAAPGQGGSQSVSASHGTGTGTGTGAGAGAGAGAGGYRAMVDAAGGEMFQAAMTKPSSAAQVASAMATLPEKAQKQIADMQASEPLKLRDSIAHQLDNDAWSTQQRDALWTIGSSRGKAAADGIAMARSGGAPDPLGAPPVTASEQTGGGAPPTAPAAQSGNGTRQAGTAGAGAGGTGSVGEQPAASAGRPPKPSGTSGGGASGPPSGPPQVLGGGARSIVTDLPEPPPSPAPAKPSPALPDLEPFLDD
jgi:hypothetical protein